MGTNVASNATNQLNNSFLKGDRFFSVRVDKGPVRLRSPVSAIVTKSINRELKRSRAYRSAKESAHAQVVLHGPGPLPWRDKWTCIPSTGGIEDVLIPSGTLCSMENLDRFALYREMSWSQLHKAAFGPTADKGWNKDYTKALMATMYGMGYQPIYQGNRWLFPEKLAEDYKEGSNCSVSSALPKALAWDFFYRDEDTGKWNRRIILDYANIGVDEKSDVARNQDLLYSKDGYADDWQNIIHWYIGNCSNVAPYRYHSVRSIGFMMFGVCALFNKLMNRNLDHMFQQLLTWFRNVSDDNREKLGLIDLQNFGVLPDGVSLVTANERYDVNHQYVQMGIDQMTQLIARAAMSFVPDMEGASKDKMMTATETLVRQNQSITLTNAVMGQLGDQSKDEYREICRRFCLKGNPDPMAKRFRDTLREEGVDLDLYLDVEAWDVVPEMTVGAGNKASELMVTQALVQEMAPVADPDGQRLIFRRRYAALTDNPDEAMAIFPEVPKPGGTDVQQAQVAFTILVEGQPYVQPEGVNHVVMAQMLMQMSAQALQQAELVMQQPQGLAIAALKVSGVANVLGHVQGEVAKVGQNEAAREMAKALEKQLKELGGQVQQLGKAIQALEEQQAQQQAQQQGGAEQQEAMMKLQQMQAEGQLKMQIAGQQAEQKATQRQAQWAEENARRNADTQAEIGRMNARTATELRNSTVKADADAQLAIMKEAKKPAPKAPAGK